MNDARRRAAIRAFNRAQWTAITVTTLALVAMVSYPGGTILNHNTNRYRLTQNFLSDLGMTVAYNGQFFAFRIFPVACLFICLAAWQSRVASASAIAAWTFATLSLSAYVAFLSLGPPPTSPGGLVASVVAQKSVVVAIVGALTYLCYETARTLRVSASSLSTPSES